MISCNMRSSDKPRIPPPSDRANQEPSIIKYETSETHQAITTLIHEAPEAQAWWGGVGSSDVPLATIQTPITSYVRNVTWRRHCSSGTGNPPPQHRHVRSPSTPRRIAGWARSDSRHRSYRWQASITDSVATAQNASRAMDAFPVVDFSFARTAIPSSS